MIKNLTAAVLLCGGAILAGAGMASAAPLANFYQATVTATDRSEAGQSAAASAALKAVLVKVAGRRSAAEDPALMALYSDAARYTQQSRAVGTNQLNVSFDKAALDRWLEQNGQTVWGNERPITFVWLTIPSGRDSGQIVTREDAGNLKRSLDMAAAARGISLLWPSGGDIAAAKLNYAAVAAGPTAPLADLGRRLGGDGVLIGRAQGATNTGVRWTLLFQGRSSEFSGATEGVQRAADLYAAAFASDGPTATVAVQLEGIASLHAYAAAQSYLEALSMVSRVELRGFAADTATFAVTARGGADSLQRAFALDSRFQGAGTGEAGALRLRFTPR
jgi:uncharacterized protein